MEYFELRDKLKVPQIGFGPDEMGYTSMRKIPRNDVLHRGIRKVKKVIYDKPVYIKSVSSAFGAGFSLLDWSAAYGDGTMLSEAIKKSKVKREKIVITTRVSNKAQFNNNVRGEFFNQLKSFKTDYIDILMFHWPVTGFYEKTWEEMIKLKEEGYCKVLGTANCNEKHLEKLKMGGGYYLK